MKYLLRNSKHLPVFFSVVLIITSSGCRKLLETDPPTTFISAENVYYSDGTAIAVLTGIYTKMSNASYNFSTGINSMSVRTSLSADELTLFAGSTNSSLIQFYKNSLSNTQKLTYWENFYSCLFQVNAAIEGLSKSSTLTSKVKNQLLGESRFLRAYCYFYLVNLYGDVPLVMTSDYRTNSTLGRTPKSLVWEQIISDLKVSQDLLDENYLDGGLRNYTATPQRIRPNKSAATALLARAYLYTGNYINAEIQSTSLINNSTVFSLPSLNDAFLSSSNEAIWQHPPVNSGWNTEDAKVFVLTGAPSNSKPVYLSASLLSAFEVGDQRLTKWISSRIAGGTTYYFANKYKSAIFNAPVTEYLTVLRLAEQYLIRAEARVHLNKIAEARDDLNTIRSRAFINPNPITTSNGDSLLVAIFHERQVELFTEWGHRWMDLKRIGTVDGIMSTIAPLKGGIWETTDQLYPLPVFDIQQNPNLIQNNGY